MRRLPRRIMVDIPDLDTRREILSVTLAANRVDIGVNFTQLAERLEGYTGSDIKGVCREAVVKVAHERAEMLVNGADLYGTRTIAKRASSASGGGAVNTMMMVSVGDFNAPLRLVTMENFQLAMKKLKASVNDNGRELQKVVEWNSKYGEIKRKPKKPSSASSQLTLCV